MLPEANRLKKKNDFDMVFKKGAGYKNSCFVLRVVKNDLDYSRFGIIASLKVSKKAVERNKVRRRIAEAIRRNLDSIKPGFDTVFIALPVALKADYKSVEKWVMELLKKAKTTNV